MIGWYVFAVHVSGGLWRESRCRCHLLRSASQKSGQVLHFPVLLRSSHSLKLVHQRIQEERQELDMGKVASASNRWRTWLSTWSAAPFARVRRGAHPIPGGDGALGDCEIRAAALPVDFGAGQGCERSAISAAISAQRATPASAKSDATRSGARQTAEGRRRSLVTARCWGCASLAPCLPPICLYARPAPVFQQSPRQGKEQRKKKGARQTAVPPNDHSALSAIIRIDGLARAGIQQARKRSRGAGRR